MAPKNHKICFVFLVFLFCKFLASDINVPRRFFGLYRDVQ